MNNDTKYLSIEQYKHCLIVISLLEKIINENLPYDQRATFQTYSDGDTVEELYTSMRDIKDYKLTCCLMGYLVAYKKAKKAGIESADGTLYYKNHAGEDGVSVFVGFDCEEIVSAATRFIKTPEEALEWFSEEFNKHRLSVYKFTG